MNGRITFNLDEVTAITLEEGVPVRFLTQNRQLSSAIIMHGLRPCVVFYKDRKHPVLITSFTLRLDMTPQGLEVTCVDPRRR